MSRIPDHDARLLLERLLDWKASEKWSEELQDPELLAEFEELESWRGILNSETEPRPGFTDEVMASIGPAPAPQRRESYVVLTTHGVLATVGCFVGLVTVLGGTAGLESAGVLPALVSLAFGVASTWRARRDSPA